MLAFPAERDEKGLITARSQVEKKNTDKSNQTEGQAGGVQSERGS